MKTPAADSRLTWDSHLLSPSFLLPNPRERPEGLAALFLGSPNEANFQVTVYVLGPGSSAPTHGEGVCRCQGPGGSISGWTGLVGLSFPPGPEVGWGWREGPAEILRHPLGSEWGQ